MGTEHFKKESENLCLLFYEKKSIDEAVIFLLTFEVLIKICVPIYLFNLLFSSINYYFLKKKKEEEALNGVEIKISGEAFK